MARVSEFETAPLTVERPVPAAPDAALAAPDVSALPLAEALPFAEALPAFAPADPPPDTEAEWFKWFDARPSPFRPACSPVCNAPFAVPSALPTADCAAPVAGAVLAAASPCA